MKVSLLRRVLNGLKLVLSLFFLSFAVLIAAAILLADVRPTPKELVLALVLLAVSLLAGVLLMISFIRTRRKWRAAAGPKPAPEVHHDRSESTIYHAARGLLKPLEGWSFNGCGTMQLTRNRRAEDGSYETITWITVFFMPLAALYQERITPMQREKSIQMPFLFSYTSAAYRRMHPAPLRRTLIWLTYAFYYLLWLPALVLPIVLLLVFLDELNRAFPGPSFWLLILGYFAWGVCWMALMEFWNKRMFLKR